MSDQIVRDIEFRQEFYNAAECSVHSWLPQGPVDIVLEFLAISKHGLERVDYLQTELGSIAVELRRTIYKKIGIAEQLKEAERINEINRGLIDLRNMPDQYDVPFQTLKLLTIRAKTNELKYQQAKMRLMIEHILCSGDPVVPSSIQLLPTGYSGSQVEPSVTARDPPPRLKVPSPERFKRRRLLMERRSRDGKAPRGVRGRFRSFARR